MHRLVLLLILVAGFALRVWNIDYGLPFVYSIDEGSHFTSRAVEMFWQDLDPGYYQNPSAYTYLVYVLLRVMYGPLGFVFDLPFGNVTDQFDKNPTEIWIAARVLAAALCMAGVAATYWAARRLWGVREGLVAAAVLAFAFLPVAYSRDRPHRRGLADREWRSRWRSRCGRTSDGRLLDFALAGACAGLAVAFKYTAGLALLPIAIAAAPQLRAQRRPRASGGLAAGGSLCAAVVFVVLNPYLFGSFDAWWSDLRDQAEVAADQPKPGQESGGVSYYLDSLTWGLGWAAALAALAGAVLELRRNLVRGLMLIAVPLALFVYLSVQSRYFGRWLLPAYPALALLAAAAAGPGGRAGRPPRRGRAGGGRCSPGLTLLVLIQPLAADVRTAQALGRDDTRQQARDWLERALPAGAARVGGAGRARVAGSAPIRRAILRPGSHAASSGTAGRSPGWSYESEGRRVCAQYKPGLVARPDGGFARRPTTPCSARR